VRDANPNDLVNAREVCRMLGDICLETLWRWLDEFPDFPRPIWINRRRYWWRSEIIAWIERREAASPKEEAAMRRRLPWMDGDDPDHPRS
jgi:predicted DNA-binding transcriptional regulator AlpA